MEMTVLGVDPFVTAEQAANHGVELVEIDELLARADVVTVHVPLTRATRGLIGETAIAKLKPGSIVLNVARGGVLDEAAVAEALRSRPSRRRRDRRLRARAADRLAAARRAEHPADPASRRVDRRGPDPRGRGGRRAGPRRARRAAAPATRSTRRCSRPRRPGRSRRTCRSPRSSAGSSPQFSRGGVKTLTLEIAGELAEYDGTPLTAAVLRGLLETTTTERVNLVNAGRPGQGARDHPRRAQDARRRRVRRAADALDRATAA